MLFLRFLHKYLKFLSFLPNCLKTIVQKSVLYKTYIFNKKIFQLILFLY